MIDVLDNKSLRDLLFLFICLKKSGMPANEMVRIFEKNLMIVWIIVIWLPFCEIILNFHDDIPKVLPPYIQNKAK